MTRTIRSYLPYILLILVGLIMLIPLLRTGFIVTDDGTWMIIRLSAFYQSFREGQFPVRFLGRLNYSYGYPVANFLYPGFLYIGSFIHVAGFSFVNTVKILLGGSLVTAGIFVYLWLRKFFKELPSLFGALSFITGPYLLFDLYTRGSVGELLALCMVALGLYSLEAGYPWLLSLAVTMLILGHNSLALLFIIIFVGYIWLRKLSLEYILWMLFGVGMASFFWIPALYEQKYIVFSRAVVSNPMEYFVQYKSLWLLGLSGIIAWIFLVVRRVKQQSLSMFLWALVVGVIMAIPVSAPLWHVRIFASLFQFPFRFLSLALFASAWLTACLLQNVKKYTWLFGIGFILIWVIHLRIIYFGIQNEYHPDSFYTTNEATTTVQNEYMPRWVSVLPTKRADQRIEFIQGSGHIENSTVSTQNINLLVDAKEQSILQINTMYYPGWGVSIDNQPVIIDYKNDMGLMRVTIPTGEHHVVASFRETISRFITDIFSFIVFTIYCIWIIIRVLKKKKKRS